MKTKQETIIFIENNKNNGKISNILKSIKDEIDFYISSNISKNNKLTLKAYSLFMNLFEIPKCKICNSEKIKFISFEKGFEKCCSLKCNRLLDKNEEIIELNEFQNRI